MNIYKKIVPETLRIEIRNIQYGVWHLFFIGRMQISKLTFKKNSKRNSNVSKSLCFIIPTTKITGGVGVVLEHLNRLKRLGYKTLVATYDNKTDLSWFPNQKVEVVPLKGNRKKIEGFDTVVATGWITAYELALLDVRRKMYFVQSDERRFYPEKSFLRNRVEYTYRFPFDFFTEARWLQEWLRKEFKKKAHLVPNGVNMDVFYVDKPMESKPNNNIRILIEGAASLSIKRVDEAFKMVSGKDYEVWYVNSDGIPSPKWKCDKYFEKVPMNQMRRIYSSCHVLLKLSRVEGFPGPPLEMMACGGVPIVSDTKEYREYVINGVNGFLIKNEEPEVITKIIDGLKNPSYYRKIVKSAAETVKKYSWDNSVKKLLNYLEYGK